MITEQALLQFLGRLHPLVLHLPIGLWLGIAMLEFGGAIVRRRAPRATIAVLAWIAALGAAFAAGAGWLLAEEGTYSGSKLELHRWFGVGAAAASVLAAAFAGLSSRRPFGLMLLVVLGALCTAGHFGSVLTHGETWLLEPFDHADGKASKPTTPPATPAATPAQTPTTAATTSDPPKVTPTPATTPPPAATGTAAAPSFANAVLPLLEQHCGKCHGETKPKGKLQLLSREGIERGGENGGVLVAGKPDDSEMLRRVLLPLDDEDHMPPPKKPQPAPAEIEVLRRWITAGAPFDVVTTPPAGHGEPAKAPADATPTDPAKPNAPAEPATPVQPATTPHDSAEPAPTPKNPDPPKKLAAAATGEAAPAADAALAAGIAALRQRLAHVAPVAVGDDGLWVDFAAIAPSTTEAEVRTLLVPVAARTQELGLARTPIGDDLLTLCARMPLLRRLDLRATRVTARGLQQLAGHGRLEELVLAQTHLDDSAVDALLSLPSLRRVHLWNAGLGAAAIDRLRQRAGLEVDTGEPIADAVLETEPDPTAVPPAKADAPAAAAPPVAADALRPINDTCPVSGKPVDPHFVIVHGDRAIGFCCPNCPARFWADPSAYKVPAR